MDAIRQGFGVWLSPQTLLKTPVVVQREQFARIERLGYRSLWSGEPPGVHGGSREAFTQHGIMLAATERLVVGTGIANIVMRDPVAMHGGAATLAEAYPDRFVLGLGGHSGPRPLTMLREYLDAMDAAAGRLLPSVRYPRVLAALGPKAHQVVDARADGAHPFLQPVRQTEIARASLGSGKLVIPQQTVVLETDPDAARGRLLALFSRGVGDAQSSYRRNYRRLGYRDDERERLIDDLLAWGDGAAVAERLRAHADAGADHVLVHPIAPDLVSTVDQLERLAPFLKG
ncbi:TIGR03620 family F420-dependent LLM class oxidoreductase [Actinomadura sp. SCN-SB]|uniref:TIGR03620 family F420-dependent LLM class oxidoreductase n=1 Tax=Actinomadura sp. SCN-SB TaxID=3373092 RepID=UPI003750C8DC